ncbi:MAG: glycoside hydrolase family 5 protein [Tannerella sp.]|jgi:hypothetical protein|nr:glycoside hydrolase family 5 protein [Tannerella sp.]
MNHYTYKNQIRVVYISLIFFLLSSISVQLQAQPIRLHPVNPHYFEYRGKPAVLVTSGEHYGAVINPAFDYVKYLNTLQMDGLNYTRIFTGSMYWEIEGDFGITNNTLAPARGTALAPWKRSDTPGNANGGHKFDLDQWDEAYFNRLKSFVEEARIRDIIVEVTLFTSIYNDKTWSHCPVNPQNNVNRIELSDYKKVHTLENGNLLKYQEKFVTKIVMELNDYDNVIYELINEPWADQAVGANRPNVWQKSALENWNSRINISSDLSLAWQSHIAQLITETEKTLAKRHLLAQNYCNEVYPIDNVDINISILNFHYAWAEAALLNYGRNKAIGFDESGFAGSDDDTYRKQAWVFLMSGGGLFNNLDYSFAVGYEDGTLTQKAPGGGSPALRKQLSILKKFVESLDFLNFSPDRNVIALSPGTYSYALSNRKDTYVIYSTGSAKALHLSIPVGEYRVKWLNPADGATIDTKSFNAHEPVSIVRMPEYDNDITIILTKN